eukprot:CAMPEP_0197625232 /NCGR_PEP_ID=MMETSP1338-20131121/4650_1 /TAXON_ID=43686 ORGANISM="Pelagodinium beii, Strain RCC1491" /NCGR_SAMPLE_ID=MMETSP1338 /ASSEMBLY_ACC=CAM_ASM_000754 /LENGTH=83 /DNA_ID=CAMNT_0043195579 /DNA_START=497 /DNA_END=747 /DNA_ORIENTATION=+
MALRLLPAAVDALAARLLGDISGRRRLPPVAVEALFSGEEGKPPPGDEGCHLLPAAVEALLCGEDGKLPTGGRQAASKAWRHL